MLRISKITDYGIVLLTQLGETGSGPRTVRDLARETGIPQPTVSKAMKRLTRGGVVRSQRGPQGGYQLSRPPHAISVADIIEVLEGPIAVTECTSDDDVDGCVHEGTCDVQANWQRINLAVQAALSGVSLADMMRPGGELVQLARSAEDAVRRRHPELQGLESEPHRVEP